MSTKTNSKGSVESDSEPKQDIIDPEEHTTKTTEDDLSPPPPAIEQPNDHYLPAGIPHEEGQAEPSKNYFAHKLACATLTLVAIVAIVGGVCGSGHCSGGSSSETVSVTSAPTSYRDSLSTEFEAKLFQTFGESFLEEEHGLIRRKTLNWILNEDPMQLESNAPNLVQRYILALFYYQTSQQSPWKACNPDGPSRCYFSPYGSPDDTKPGSAWLSDNHECFWATVQCSGQGNRNVTAIQLYDKDMGLHGAIPTELAKLTHLTELALGGQYLTGTIPTELAELTLLEVLNLRINQLEGSIPPQLFEPLQNLAYFTVSSNFLTGSLPSTIGFFPGKGLRLFRNDLTGSLPTELYSLSHLSSLILTSNDITGTIATEIGNMKNLSAIYFKHTLVSGTIPSQIGLLSDTLQEINLEGTQVGGTLPEELFTHLSKLKFLLLSNCAFSGTLSSNIGLRSDMSYLDLANNQFEGSIPTEIASLTNLYSFSIQGNAFSGTFPQSVCTNSFSETVWKDSITADCLPDEGGGIASMECECCTECCNANTGICREV